MIQWNYTDDQQMRIWSKMLQLFFRYRNTDVFIAIQQLFGNLPEISLWLLLRFSLDIKSITTFDLLNRGNAEPWKLRCPFRLEESCCKSELRHFKWE